MPFANNKAHCFFAEYADRIVRSKIWAVIVCDEKYHHPFLAEQTEMSSNVYHFNWHSVFTCSLNYIKGRRKNKWKTKKETYKRFPRSLGIFGFKNPLIYGQFLWVRIGFYEVREKSILKISSFISKYWLTTIYWSLECQIWWLFGSILSIRWEPMKWHRFCLIEW